MSDENISATKKQILDLLTQAMPSNGDTDARTRAKELLAKYGTEVTNATARDVIWRFGQAAGDMAVEAFYDENEDYAHLR